MQRAMLCAAVASAAVAAPAPGQDPTREEIDSLREQVAELKETVAALKAGQQDPNDLSAARAAEIRAQVTSVLADAETFAVACFRTFDQLLDLGRILQIRELFPFAARQLIYSAGVIASAGAVIER